MERNISLTLAEAAYEVDFSQLLHVGLLVTP